LSATGSIASPSVAGGSVVSPSALVGIFSIASPQIIGGAVVFAESASGEFSLPGSTVTIIVTLFPQFRMRTATFDSILERSSVFASKRISTGVFESRIKRFATF
jgi:hypothetical protein